jgi:diguanylate cyclase (GGDEF)-like protein/PAS domain S-box-containing protein
MKYYPVNKKIAIVVIILSILLGLMYWFILPIVEFLFFNPSQSSLESYFQTGALSYRLIKSLMAVILFMFFGFTLGYILKKQKIRFYEITFQQKEKLNQHLNVLDLMIMYVDKDLNIEIVNNKTSQVLEIDKDDLLGKKLYETRIADTISDNIRENINKETPPDSIKPIEIRYVSKTGKERFIRWRVSFMKDITDGGLDEILIVGEDISEEIRYDKELKESENRFREAVMNAPLPIMLHNDKNDVILINDAWTELTGYTVQDVSTIDEWVKFVHNENEDKYKKYIDGLSDIHKKMIAENIKVRKKSGDTLIWNFTSAPLGYDSNGNKIVISMAFDVTDKIKKDQEIKDMARLPDENPYPVIRLSKDFEVLYSNNTGNELINLWTDGSKKNDADYYRNIIKDIYKLGENKNLEVEIKEKTLWLSIVPIKDLGYINIYGQEITKLKKARQELKLIAKVFENSNEGIVITKPDGTIINANHAFLDITGYSKDEIIGSNPRIIKSDKHDDLFYQNMWNSLLNDEQWQGEIWNRRKNGEIYPAWLSISSIKDENNNLTHYIGMSMDISKAKETEEQIRKLINYDPLTGTPNRNLLLDRLNQALVKAEMDDKIHMVALIYIDLDNFKLINETLGHISGDSLLVEVTERLKSCIGKSDTIARLSGDEFAIVLTNLLRTITAASTVKKIIEELSKPIIIENKEVFITISAGISIYPFDGKDMETLLRNADSAMHYVKNRGKNNYQFYSQTMNRSAIERLEMETALRKALEREEFILYYQPKYSLKEDKICGVEALIRWNHPEMGIVSPVKFIGIAEEIGFITDIGEWVMYTACKQIKQLEKKGITGLNVSVNLSSKQFHQTEIVDKIQSAIKMSRLNPNQLELEITESIIMSNAKYIITKLYALKERNIKLSIDDFGTGYSSLSYLKYFPINSIKIDRSFIMDCITDKDNAEIAKAIIALSHSLSLMVVAEGVETKEQLEFLRDNDCDFVQGYLISKPYPIEDIEKLILDNVKF